jgi:mannose-6-phosphate isomerase
MSNPRIYPLTFTPALRDYLWGGRRLETLFGRKLPPGRVAESWEISGHPHAPTPADTGYWAGQPLPEILADLGERLTGSRSWWALKRDKFPLLVKLLDADLDLSVQVHPNDVFAQAHEHGELGKAEMWYVLHAEPGAGVILGLRPGTTEAELTAALAEGTLEALLERIPVRAGQAIALPTGTLHALLAGTVVTEIQQNSDTTYRVYDWGRVGPDGKARELHVEKALQVIDLAASHGIVVPRLIGMAPGIVRRELVRNPYFVVEEVSLMSGAAYTGACDGSTLEIWGCVAGTAAIESEGAGVGLPAVRYALLPAALGEFAVRAERQCTCLRAYLPEVA